MSTEEDRDREADRACSLERDVRDAELGAAEAAAAKAPPPLAEITDEQWAKARAALEEKFPNLKGEAGQRELDEWMAKAKVAVAELTPEERGAWVAEVVDGKAAIPGINLASRLAAELVDAVQVPAAFVMIWDPQNGLSLGSAREKTDEMRWWEVLVRDVEKAIGEVLVRARARRVAAELQKKNLVHAASCASLMGGDCNCRDGGGIVIP